jgi:hypothetical protein
MVSADDLNLEISRTRERLSRCDDLFGKMLMTGKLKRLYRERDALSNTANSGGIAK